MTRYRGTVPLGRLNKPEDLAAAALFLASDDAAMITGSVVPGRRGAMHLDAVDRPLAADSLGVRSMATYVECGETRVLIDPGAMLAPTRFNLAPAEEEWEALRRANDRISAYATRASLVFVSHYHEDHFRHDPGFYAGRPLWAKDAKRHARGPAGAAGGGAVARARGPCRAARGRGTAARDGGRGAAGLAAARPRRRRDGAGLRGGAHHRGPARGHALRPRLRRAGAAVTGGRRLPGPPAPHAALPVRPAGLPRGADRLRARSIAASSTCCASSIRPAAA